MVESSQPSKSVCWERLLDSIHLESYIVSYSGRIHVI